MMKLEESQALGSSAFAKVFADCEQKELARILLSVFKKKLLGSFEVKATALQCIVRVLKIQELSEQIETQSRFLAEF